MKKYLNKILTLIFAIILKIKSIVLSLPLIRIYKNEINYFINRYSFSIVLGSFITLSLFYLMSQLIFQENQIKKDQDESHSIQFLMNKTIEDLELRSRRMPKKPKDPNPEPAKPKIKISTQVEKKPLLLKSSLPKLNLSKDFLNKGEGMMNIASSENSDVVPLVRIEPSYPRKAAIRGIEGFVILQFDISLLGTTDNISVIQASPPQIFNSKAIQALKRWRYKPKTINGKSQIQKNLKIQLDFKLENK